ncbi:hypothetical protein Metev_0652 [Methanohalobium evestigatum Z-7303]|uniref:Uncharacterized protein n=1 Tax=Methanohalobium evestigatum (strain ATCC BAA-1072 / DSM 3721 / NBRC 107634 / OCM 161 / Z-7303) TaxID=644295 RepID=D7E6T4_METEZ|nr:hypothetical protein [Methanohalobium evestigatum]ADI73558.1 hypothetical protein Metev_0652 [Methanohalobium evestigatum Z-7303]
MSSQTEKVSHPKKTGFTYFSGMKTVPITFQEYVEGFAEHTERNVFDSCIYCGRSAQCYLAQVTAELSVIGHFECEEGHQYSKLVGSNELYEDFQKYGGKKLVPTTKSDAIARQKVRMKKGGRR